MAFPSGAPPRPPLKELLKKFLQDPQNFLSALPRRTFAAKKSVSEEFLKGHRETIFKKIPMI